MCTECTHCPFALTDESEYIQGLGCLPSLYDVMQMKRKSGHNWACHSNENRICAGFAQYVKKLNSADIDTTTGGLISYETWYHKGEEAALLEADMGRNKRG